jgi:hypothetical protein
MRALVARPYASTDQRSHTGRRWVVSDLNGAESTVRPRVSNDVIRARIELPRDDSASGFNHTRVAAQMSASQSAQGGTGKCLLCFRVPVITRDVHLEQVRRLTLIVGKERDRPVVEAGEAGLRLRE